LKLWRGIAACKLALDNFRHNADQQGADGDRAGGCEFTKPGFDCEVESSSLCPDGPWMPRDPSLSDRAVTIWLNRSNQGVIFAMKNNVWRAVIEVGFIIFLFYSNLLRGEFERSVIGGNGVIVR